MPQICSFDYHWLPTGYASLSNVVHSVTELNAPPHCVRIQLYYFRMRGLGLLHDAMLVQAGGRFWEMGYRHGRRWRRTLRRPAGGSAKPMTEKGGKFKAELSDVVHSVTPH